MRHGLREAKNSRVLFLDMNSFFASIEQQKRPELRHRPVAVVSHLTSSGTVLAASYEAKAFGIKTGSKVGQALLYCPDLYCLTGSVGMYQAVHRHFMDILYRLFGPEAQPRSIDEAALFLPPNWQFSAISWKLARQIKETFSQELGEYIRCSIGIAPNSFLAKLATDLQKPDGLVEITLENTVQILSGLRLQDLPGIAQGNEAILALRGIITPLQFYQAPAPWLFKTFGIWGQQWWWRLHGYEVDSGYNPVLKTMSHQHVLKRWQPSVPQAIPIIAKMADQLIHRLRHNHFCCQAAWMYLSLAGRSGLNAERRFDAPTNSYYFLLHTFYELAFTLPEALSPIRKITMGFVRLTSVESGLQLDLFNRVNREEMISQALETVRGEHGFQSIQLGNVVGIDHQIATEQIGFGRVKDRL